MAHGPADKLSVGRYRDRVDQRSARMVEPGEFQREHLPPRETEFFIDNLLVQIHLIIEMISVDRPCAMAFEFPFPGCLISTFLVSPTLSSKNLSDKTYKTPQPLTLHPTLYVKRQTLYQEARNTSAYPGVDCQHLITPALTGAPVSATLYEKRIKSKLCSDEAAYTNF